MQLIYEEIYCHSIIVFILDHASGVPQGYRSTKGSTVL